MYLYDRRTSGQNRRSQNPVVLRPSQIYQYPQSESLDLGFLSFLSGLAGPAEDLAKARKAGTSREEVFKLLRKQKSFPLGTAAEAELDLIFSAVPEELWIAKTLSRLGPEPLWPVAEIKERVKKATKLVNEPGNYKATLADPTPGKALSGSLSSCVDKLTPSQLPDALFFPGRDERRALIIAGVHGDEQGGVEVVKSLQALLEKNSSAGKKPFFSTILVPVVIPRTPLLPPKDRRNVPGGIGLNDRGRVECHIAEPNRNFPLPGMDLKQARDRGKLKITDPELVIRDGCGNIRAAQGEKTTIRMLPETRILISLIERFQPERLASVHDHSLVQRCHPCFGRDTLCGGEGPGIFVDPRGISPVTRRIEDSKQVKEDDELVTKMLDRAVADLSGKKITSRLSPLSGNLALPSPKVRYFSEQRVEGNSLGDWAPVKTTSRPAITTLTIEVPKEGFVDSKAKKILIELHRAILNAIFLET